MIGSAVSVDDLLGCEPDGDQLRADLGSQLHGAFGGAFGGVVAAAAIRAARRAAPHRRPASLDVRFLRGLPAGSAQLRPSVLRAGRSLTTVSVDIFDGAERLAARATIGLTDPSALHPLDRSGETEAPDVRSYGEGSDWRPPAGVEIPIVDILRPRVLGSGPWGVATGLPLPWTEPGADAEGACLAADMCVGPPVAAACTERWIAHPNPDLSLRFVGSVAGTLTGVGRLERIDSGLAAVAITVWSGAEVAAVGAASSMLLGQQGRTR